MPATQLEAEKAKHIREPFPNGESYQDVVERMRDFLDELAERWDGKRVLLIGHSATRFALDYLLNGIALEELISAPFNWQQGWRFRL
jgi:broad specificity phosphatase PhoE